MRGTLRRECLDHLLIYGERRLRRILAERDIAILAYSALFLAEDAGILRILADKGRAGVTVRIALADPGGPHTAQRGEEEGIGDAMPAEIRNALMLYRPLGTVPNIEIRLHRTVLYNSIYRADGQFVINQHTYGIPAAQAPAFCCAIRAAARWPPSTVTASSAYGLVPPSRIAVPVSAQRSAKATTLRTLSCVSAGCG